MDLPVVGRDEPLAQLQSFIVGVADGAEPRCLLLEGEAGIGKTTLWQAAVDDAAAAGYSVLVSRPAESETALAYSGLADLLAPVAGSVLADLPAPQRHALEVALLLAEPTRRPPDPRAIFAAFGTALAALARDAPVLVAIDDLQWLDLSSSSALTFASRRLAAQQVGILATARLPSGVSTKKPVGLPGADVVRLGALSAAVLHRLIKARSGVSLPRPTVLRVHRMTGGNPFLALELARVLIASDLPAASEEWPVPDDIRELASASVGQLTRPTRAVLLAAAANGRPTIPGLSGSRLRAAERAGIVASTPNGEVQFAHPLFASAIYGSASPRERRRVHAALAARATDLENQARHSALACESADEDVAKLLDRAAVKARARGSPEIAAEFAERAVSLTPADRPSDSSRRIIAAADFSFQAGDLEHARAVLHELVHRPGSSPPSSHALRLLGECCYHLGQLDVALGYLRQAVAAGAGDLALVALAELDLAFALSQSLGDFTESGAAVDRSLAAAEALGDGPLLSSALAARLATDFFFQGHGTNEQSLERALALEDLDLPGRIERRPSYLVGMVLAYAEEVDRARPVLERLSANLVAHGEESDLPEVLTLLAMVECLAGNLSSAAELADRGHELAAQAASGSLAASTRAIRALVDAHAGRIGETRAAARDAIELAGQSGWQIAELWASTALGLLEVSLGNDLAVTELLSHSIGLVEERGVREPARHPYLPDAIEALVHLGELDRADRLTGFLEERARALDRWTTLVRAARCRALVLAARGDVPAALSELDGLVDAETVAPLPLELARTLIVKGQLERRRKQKRAARELLQRALDICEEIGASLWAERARSELARLGFVHQPGELTASEARVAQLAAAGLTNREIATSAFMSQKTVEANLSRIYRKLGIRSRAELGLKLAEADEAASR